MKHLKLFESFDNEIESICDELNITNWTLNEDGTVDVDGDVDMNYMGLNKIPLKFGKVIGGFDCSRNPLISLDGCPREVGEYFICNDSKLTSLKGAPNLVGGIFDCANNFLTTLKGSPKEIGGDFDCSIIA